jgi:hypothetical protein
MLRHPYLSDQLAVARRAEVERGCQRAWMREGKEHRVRARSRLAAVVRSRGGRNTVGRAPSAETNNPAFN